MLFQAQEHFSNTLMEFSELGMNIGTCTGTCSWSTLTGAPDMALNNGYAAAKASQRLGSMMISVTSHWSSHPSLGQIAFALPGFLIGAGHSWNSSTPKTFVETVFSDLADVHLLGEWQNVDFNATGSVGKALVELGKAESSLNKGEESVLLKLLSEPEKFDAKPCCVDDWNHAIRRIKKSQALLFKCPKPMSILSENYRHEILLSSELLLLSVRLGRSLIMEALASDNERVARVGIADLPSTFRTDIANK